MTNDQDHEPFEPGDLDAEVGLEDFETGGGGTFADAWKTNPMVKIGVVLGILAVIVGGFMLFGGSAKPLAPSAMPGAAQQQLTEVPGGKVSTVYGDALKEINDRNADTAARTGGSSLPIPIGPSKGKLEAEVNNDSAEDPLERWRRIQEERLKKEQQEKVEPAAAPEQKPVDPYANEKKALSGSMQSQMTSILDAQSLKSLKTVDITADEWLVEKRRAEAEAAQAAEAAILGDGAVGDNTVQILLEAGRIEYAQLINKADSDVPGPILAQLASGPLAGDRLIGSFQKKDEYLVLSFDTVVHDGIALSTTAVALDPKTASPGVATDVDHKYFQRIILPAAASFIQGIGEAISTSGTTTVSAGTGTTTSSSSDLDAKQELFKGIDKAAEKLGDVLDKDAQRVDIRVVVAAGTHIGVFFTKEVAKTPLGANPPVAVNQGNTAVSPTQQLLLQLAPAATPQAQLQQAIQTQPAAMPSGQ